MTIYLEENIRSSPEVDNITNDQTFSSPANGNGDGEVYQQEGQQTVELQSGFITHCGRGSFFAFPRLV